MLPARLASDITEHCMWINLADKYDERVHRIRRPPHDILPDEWTIVVNHLADDDDLDDSWIFDTFDDEPSALHAFDLLNSVSYPTSGVAVADLWSPEDVDGIACLMCERIVAPAA